MSNEKVVSIASCGSEIFGISETGRLVQYDKTIGKFVVRAASDILDHDTATVLKMPGVVTDNKHQGRYRIAEPVQIAAPSRIKTMLEPVNVAIGLVGLIILMYFFIR
jgi:hypothetical protein